MISFGLRIDPEVLKKAREKAGLIPLSIIIRCLIQKWLEGSIDVELN